MKRSSKSPRSHVLLVAFDEKGQVVEELSLSIEDYYDGSPPLIDDGSYRKSKRIVRLLGSIWNSAGKQVQQFENRYNHRGELVYNKTVHEDGTVTSLP